MKMTEKLQYKIKLDTTNRHEQTISLYEGDNLLEEVKGKENIRLEKELGPISFDSQENIQPVLI